MNFIANVAVTRAALLLNIRKVQPSGLDPKTCYPRPSFPWFCPVPGKYYQQIKLWLLPYTFDVVIRLTITQHCTASATAYLFKGIVRNES